MGNDKTVAERLREINDYNSTVGCELFNMLNGTRDCTNWTCKGCRKATYTALADMIEAEQAANASKPMSLPEGIVIPHDAEGEPCWLDDAVWHKGRKHLVVAVSHKDKVCIRDWETRDSGKGAVWVEAYRVTHRKPDTQDDLEADVEDWVKDNFDGYPVEAYGAITGFLKRQRKLLGGE